MVQRIPVSIVIFLFYVQVQPADAHGLRISSVALQRHHHEHLPTVENEWWISFDIRWEDSWRGILNEDHHNIENWDAVWGFVKFRNLRNGEPQGAWKHAKIMGRLQHSDATIKISADRRGFFIYRKEKSCERVDLGREGCRDTVDFRGVHVLWQAEDKFHKDDEIEVWVMGLEMVYVPEGAFHVGEARCAKKEEDEVLSRCFYNPGDEAHYLISDESKIDLCKKGREGLCYLRADGEKGLKAKIGPKFPKGYRAFYAMRYELNQGQYTDYLNTLPLSARTLRFPYGAQNSYRYQIYWDRAGSRLRVAQRPERANNWVSWSDMVAYLDWAALRPMTELEFEKLARGPGKPTEGEFAWGTDEILPATVIVGTEDDGITVNGNCHIGDEEGKENFLIGGDKGFGPLPGDAFAISTGEFQHTLVAPGLRRFSSAGVPVALNLREREGRSYYGAAHLSGNLWEMVVSVSAGQEYKGTHGDGQLERDDCTDGEPFGIGWTNCGDRADNQDWPGDDGKGGGFKGGAWFTDREKATVAGRHGIDAFYPFRSHDVGIRGVRTVFNSSDPSSYEPSHD